MNPSKPRLHRALNARTVQTITGTGKTQRLADGDGLYLLVAPGGSKSWVLRTLVKEKRCDLGLGSAALVSLAEARGHALRLRRIARDFDRHITIQLRRMHRADLAGMPTVS